MMVANSLAARELGQALGPLNGSDGNTAAVVDFLLRESLLDTTHLKAWAVKMAVQRLTAEGYSKMAAMEVVAEQMALSFFTVRKYIYTTYK